MILEESFKIQKNENLLKELESNKENLGLATLILDELENRLNNNTFTFNKANINYLYLFMFLCNKTEHISILNTLINNHDFIKLLDSSDIQGSMLPTLTANCEKPRKELLINSKKLKNSILENDELLDTEDILADLTDEEIIILRNEIIEIDNYLINAGLRFDTLKPATTTRLLSELNTLSLYSIKTINEFTNSLKNISKLAEDEQFMQLYLSKLTNEYYYENKIFEYLTIDSVKKIIESNPENHILLHLVKDTIGKTQDYLLKSERIQKLLADCTNEFILNKIPSKVKVDLLTERVNLFSDNNLKLLSTLTKKEVGTILSKNKYYYPDLIAKINDGYDTNLSLFILSLPPVLLKDLKENQLSDFSINSIINLLKMDKELFKKAILSSRETSTNIVNNVVPRTYKKIEELFTIGDFTDEDKIKLLNNVNIFNNSKVIINIINDIPLAYRQSLYENQKIRQALFNDETYKLDEYSIKYLIEHLEELQTMPAKIIITTLNNSDIKIANEILSNQEVIGKLFKSKEENFVEFIVTTIKKQNSFMKIFNNKSVIKYYDKELLQAILEPLTINEKNEFCTNDLIKHILNDDELFKIYKNLLNKNGYLLNTLNFNILTCDIKSLKLSIIDEITRYRDIQEYIIKINKTFKLFPSFINNIFYNGNDLTLRETIKDCLKVLMDSALGINRKVIGNIPKMLSVIDTNNIEKDEFLNIINYILYLIPRYYNSNKEKITRPIYLETPSTYNEIKLYEEKTNELLTSKIANCEEKKVVEYFIAKHFKLSKEEAVIFNNTYSTSRIDESIYKKEYEYLNNLNRVLNTDPTSLREMDKTYKTITMYESFAIENEIKKMYGKIFNFEIRSKTYSNNPFIKTIYGKELKIYECPSDFLFLISNVDFKEEYNLTYSYFESWHNTINKLPNGINTSLVSNDNFVFTEDFIFGFNGVLDEGIIKMSNKQICANCLNKTNEKYMTPRELIDNTRDTNNTIIIDRYAIRPNYNNSNIPNIEPDFILADKTKLEDNEYLEKISRASLEFKTKRNKNGLPIIAIDIEKISDNEVSKLNQLYTKYNKTHDMTLITSMLTKLENNYTSYRTFNSDIVAKFDFIILKNILTNRLKETNSLAELDYIEETLEKEYLKFNNLSKELACNFDLKNLKTQIKNRKDILSK